MKNTLILGAGASVPYGFPSGEKLMEDICSRMPTILKNSSLYDPDDFAKKVREEIAMGSYKSIDTYLRDFRTHTEFIKASIAHIILSCEHRDSLYPNGNTPFSGWYDWYFNQLIPDATSIENLPVQNIVTFNYDRSLEYFLFNYIKARAQNHFAQFTPGTGQHSGAIFNFLHEKFKIYHVYGRLPNLPHESYFEKEQDQLLNHVMDYGSTNLGIAHLIPIASKRIRTIYEEEQNKENLEEIKTILHDSKEIYLLGCGLHRENLELLGFPYPSKKVVSTNFKLPKTIATSANQTYRVTFPIEHPSVDCRTFFMEHVSV